MIPLSRFFRFGHVENGERRFTAETMPRGFRLIGTGQIGGKARGLAFIADHLERGGQISDHDHLVRLPDASVVATDVFDAFMETNSLSASVLARCQEEIGAEELSDRIVSGVFPSEARGALRRFLEAEERPLVVRSSSVMEDGPEHSFAGIYLSAFLSNTGPLERRLDALVLAIKRVYASTFGRNARAYRKQHGLDWENEKMAVLIQNMIGRHYPHDLFYPLIGGVGFSLNFYPWSDRLAPEDGVVRLVVGTGTRAVGREYARVFSPKAPGIRPEGTDTATVVKYSQETVDVLDMKRGFLVQTRLSRLDNPLLREVCSVVDLDGTMREPVGLLPPGARYVATFARLIERDTLMPLTPLIRDLFVRLRALFELPVDIEFAIDFPSGPDGEGELLFFLLQARPLGGRSEHRRILLPVLSKECILLECHEVLGNGLLRGIRHLVFVDPRTYRGDRAYAIARTVGRIGRGLEEERFVLIGPGRWGTSNPYLGVPVQYSEIAGASVIVEMATESFDPELSYGTHFFADMVARGVLYLPFREEADDRFHRGLLEGLRVAYADDYVRHFSIPEGLDVYVDGKGKRGVIALRQPVDTCSS